LVELHGWNHLTEENKLTLTKYSDIAPKWFAQLDYVQDSHPVACEQPGNINRQIKGFSLLIDSESCDDEWTPSTKSSPAEELDSASTRSSRSTSSSRAASFVDEDDANVLGITELPSVCASGNWTHVMHSNDCQKSNESNGFDGHESEGRTPLSVRSRVTDVTGSWANNLEVSSEPSEVKSQSIDNCSLVSQDDENSAIDVPHTELQSLLSDSVTPLHIILQPYVDNGWEVPQPVVCGLGGACKDQDNNRCPGIVTPTEVSDAGIISSCSFTIVPLEYYYF
uniref:Autophagy_act_C domain-containing protein n=1 Tax=Echinostoma caproni TaxID=27848 RepID=A0A183BCK4_9TREM